MALPSILSAPMELTSFRVTSYARHKSLVLLRVKSVYAGSFCFRTKFLNHSNIEAVSNKRQPGDSPRTTKPKRTQSVRLDCSLNIHHSFCACVCFYFALRAF